MESITQIGLRIDKIFAWDFLHSILEMFIAMNASRFCSELESLKTAHSWQKRHCVRKCRHSNLLWAPFAKYCIHSQLGMHGQLLSINQIDSSATKFLNGNSTTEEQRGSDITAERSVLPSFSLQRFISLQSCCGSDAGFRSSLVRIGPAIGMAMMR